MAQTLIAEDATVTIEGGGADDGAISAASSPITLRWRTVKIKLENMLVDTTAANDSYKKNRIGHKDFTATISGLIHNSNTNYPDLSHVGFNNSLARVTCRLIGSGKLFTFEGVIQSLDVNVDEPDTEELVLKPGEGCAAPTLA